MGQQFKNFQINWTLKNLFVICSQENDIIKFCSIFAKTLIELFSEKYLIHLAGGCDFTTCDMNYLKNKNYSAAIYL